MSEDYKQKYIKIKSQLSTYRELIMIALVCIIVLMIITSMQSTRIDNMTFEQNQTLSISTQLACFDGCKNIFDYRYSDYTQKDMCRDECIRKYGFEYQKELLRD